MSLLPRDRRTVADYLSWAESQEQGRYELIDGQIVAMAPERMAHAGAKFDITVALRRAIRDAGVPCQAVVDGLAVVIDERTSFVPDALENCGPAIPGNEMVAPNPVVVVEVLSPSCQCVDKTNKLLGYFRVGGLQHYLIVDPDNRAVVHHRRTPECAVQTALVRVGAIVLDPPGISISVEEFLV